jgi:ABC-type nickel/cobalt efflux system permease component RcnA
MFSILFLGLMIGMQHALEADHVAAVSSIAARQSSLKKVILHGSVWGLGHTLALMAFAGSVLVLGLTISEHLAGWLEFGVGLMLVGLGLHLLYRLYRDRIHFHAHHHGDVRHFHAHSHAGERAEHQQSPHDHEHTQKLPVRTLVVGLIHGMAGSAALLLLTTATQTSVVNGVLYVAVFGFGSILGMAVLSAVIAVPLTYSAKYLTWANTGLQVVVGIVTIGLGSAVMLGHLFPGFA